MRIVPEPRANQGDVWGGWLDLSRAAKEEAKVIGCNPVSLTTFGFQARPFYGRRGCTVVADVPDLPGGHTHHVLTREPG